MTIATESRRAKAQAGFTLIELSIVLVIIGLLVGGILKGQELINSTQIKTQVAQVDAVRAAITTFQDRYRGLPGDIPNATVAQLPPLAGAADGNGGNGNGQVGGALAAVNTDIIPGAASEQDQALEHLARAKMLEGIQLGAPNTLTGKVSGSGLVVTAMANWNYAGAGVVTNVVRLAGGNGYANAGALSPLSAGDIDRKYDDGRPGTGSIMTLGTGNSACVTAAAVGGAYDTVDASNCLMAFRLF